MTAYAFTAGAKAIRIAVSDTASASTTLPGGGASLRVVNLGPNVVYISVGRDEQVATVPNSTPSNASCPVIPGDCVLNIPASYNTTTQISAICDLGGSADIIIQTGEGI